MKIQQRIGSIPTRPGAACEWQLAERQPVVSLSGCASKGKSTLRSHTGHISIVVFTHTEQMQVYKPDVSVVEPTCWLMQISSLPRADPPVPCHPVWEQCLGRSKGRASFIQRGKLLLLSVNYVGKISEVITMDPPQMGTLPSMQGSPGSAWAIAEPVPEAALPGAGAHGSLSCLLWVLTSLRDT